MAHSFVIRQLPEDLTIMVCTCGLTYRWYRNYWKVVGFEDENGTEIEAPLSDCVAPEEEQEGGVNERYRADETAD